MVTWSTGRGTSLARTRGFTLLELLVTVGIIAILATLILPALAKVKDRAKMTTCVNNLRQITLGVKMYVSDHQRFPLGGYFDADRKFKLTSQTIGGFSPLKTHAPYWLSAERRPMYSYVPPSKVYRCTADKGIRRAHCSVQPEVMPQPNAFETIGNSYSYNAGNRRVIAEASIGLRERSAGPLAGKPEAWVKHPDKYILLYEPPAKSCPYVQWHYNQGACEICDPRAAPPNFISPIAFVDGHVAVHNFSKALLEDPRYPYEATKDWVWYQPVK
jgi:prepilin-type N-terminal cleavage/methylation domain-containing protein